MFACVVPFRHVPRVCEGFWWRLPVPPESVDIDLPYVELGGCLNESEWVTNGLSRQPSQKAMRSLFCTVFEA